MKWLKRIPYNLILVRTLNNIKNSKISAKLIQKKIKPHFSLINDYRFIKVKLYVLPKRPRFQILQFRNYEIIDLFIILIII